MSTRIKFCGITNQEDLQLAAALGVEAVGLVFHQASSRAIRSTQAKVLLDQRPPLLSYIGLFLNEDPLFVENVLKTVHLDMLQFHGLESAEYCEAFGLPYLKSVSMQETPRIEQLEASYQSASGFVLDSHPAGEQGGTGKTFDWHKIVGKFTKPVILAGGLRPDNVAQSIKIAAPYAVDVSSGIELEKRKKDPSKMAAFVKAVRELDEY